MKITSKELRRKWIEFYESKGHTNIGAVSLIGDGTTGVMFNVAGMQPLMPYLLGKAHPKGKRLCNVQGCVRLIDIESVGDASHFTFFEMMGNWSLGDYFKKESITFSFDFLTKVLGIDVDKISVTVFKGDEDAPRDEESADIWNSLGIPRDHIFYLDKKHNWWGPAGITGPCGPDTEIFMDTGKPKCSEHCDPSCDCGKYVEIWNNVFMQYNKTKEGTFEPLKQKNVDTGMGLERTVCMLAGVGSVYETDFFSDVIAMLEEMSGHSYKESESVTKAMRIISDHIRTATFIMGDERGVTPSNVDQGYVLRRLIRRAVRYARVIDLDAKRLIEISDKYVSKYGDVYPELCENKAKVLSELETEIDRFTRTLENGLKELYKVLKYVNGDTLNGKTAFRLYDTYGFPIEMTEELAKEEGYKVDIEGYHKAFEEHQKKSQAGAEQKFKGGLQDNTELTTNLHTATHIMLQSLKRVLGEEVNQKGSNITAERLRFDFNFSRPMTKEEIEKVENMVNDVISKDLTITCEEMTVDEAMKKNAIGVFGSRYGEIVKVYSIGDFDVQICGGPHAERTGILGKFKIVKEQSSSAGVRRIKAVLEK